MNLQRGGHGIGSGSQFPEINNQSYFPVFTKVAFPANKVLYQLYTLHREEYVDMLVMEFQSPNQQQHAMEELRQQYEQHGDNWVLFQNYCSLLLENGKIYGHPNLQVNLFAVNDSLRVCFPFILVN